MRDWKDYWNQHPSMLHAEKGLKIAIAMAAIPSCFILGSSGHPSGYCFALPIAPAAGAWVLASLLTRRPERVGPPWLWGPVLLIVCVAIANIHRGVGVFWLGAIALVLALTLGLKQPIKQRIKLQQPSTDLPAPKN